MGIQREVNQLKKKAYLFLITTVLAICVMMIFAQLSFATVVESGGTGPQTGGTTGGTTGSPLLILGGIGSALVGAGYLLRRAKAS
ncbi:MAG: hypothetical protein C4534_10455 [Gaiellales bacterium]|nr:MAG: hypothetical protein C4534_10455 [Gaiellales bacterium]